jgi:hypothetical protein
MGSEAAPVFEELGNGDLSGWKGSRTVGRWWLAMSMRSGVVMVVIPAARQLVD